MIGIANEHSIAYGCADKFREAGGELTLAGIGENAVLVRKKICKRLIWLVEFKEE